MTRRAVWVAGGVIAAAFGAACGSSAPCPLCDAVEARDVARVREVLQAGAAVDRVAWELAVTSLSNGDAEGTALVSALATHGADPNHRVAAAGSARRGAMSPSGATAVAGTIARNTSDLAVIDALIRHGLDVKGEPGAAALSGAAVAGHTAVVERLLAAGVPVNATSEGETALSHAIQRRDLAAIAVLEKAGGLEW